MKFAKGLQEIQIVLIKYNNMVYILNVSKSSSVFSYIILLHLCLDSPFSRDRYFDGGSTFRKQKMFYTKCNPHSWQDQWASTVVFLGRSHERLGATQNNIDSLSQLHHQESIPRITTLPALQAKNSATELFFGSKRHKFVKKKVTRYM